jgi:hypothetical protein
LEAKIIQLISRALDAALSGKQVAREVTPEITTKRDNTNSDVSKRDDSENALDSVNLNVPADGVTMTFVEEVDNEEA